jgi:hypothetical protein
MEFSMWPWEGEPYMNDQNANHSRTDIPSKREFCSKVTASFVPPKLEVVLALGEVDSTWKGARRRDAPEARWGREVGDIYVV